ncbi:CRISPR-associated protein, Cmr5 family [Thermocrinis albus DSM 14484]|uniref:CRISPR type III-B/RAMP module-associated protein Cmr5 n=1 Tax=Thermocrinis albus (strain DSM 14484 / JCM 11386 / HI 11/12) TaxID=638303 RepID=D3SNB1_THEAH|nr:type III-B CRISPR module-associated protein Cmr5 [Thermocrinis albus]ADC88648.1 CRISPR-associated protein, Cmr5 family [Thermocrinis albus DSM 14484]
MMAVKNLEQERMRIAYESVMRVKGENFESKYSILAKRLPAMISHNGLLTTLAFLKSKGKDEHKRLIEDICKYLSHRFGNEIRSYKELISMLFQADTTMYLFYTREVLSFAVWLKRIAEGELKSEREG